MTVDSLPNIKNSHSEILLRSDNIVQVNASDHVYSIADIKENTKAIGDLTSNQKTLVLVITSEYSDIEPDARIFTSTPEAMKYSIAEAYVIKSLAQRLIANFMLNVRGFSVPLKFFNESDPAIEWLKTFNIDKSTLQ